MGTNKDTSDTTIREDGADERIAATFSDGIFDLRLEAGALIGVDPLVLTNKELAANLRHVRLVAEGAEASTEKPKEEAWSPEAARAKLLELLQEFSDRQETEAHDIEVALLIEGADNDPCRSRNAWLLWCGAILGYDPLDEEQPMTGPEIEADFARATRELEAREPSYPIGKITLGGLTHDVTDVKVTPYIFKIGDRVELLGCSPETSRDFGDATGHVYGLIIEFGKGKIAIRPETRATSSITLFRGPGTLSLMTHKADAVFTVDGLKPELKTTKEALAASDRVLDGERSLTRNAQAGWNDAERRCRELKSKLSSAEEQIAVQSDSLKKLAERLKEADRLGRRLGRDEALLKTPTIELLAFVAGRAFRKAGVQ